MNKPAISYRRISRLKAIAFACGFTNEDAKQFGKLSKTATWEALLETYGIPLQVVDIVDTVNMEAQSLDTSDWTNDALCGPSDGRCAGGQRPEKEGQTVGQRSVQESFVAMVLLPPRSFPQQSTARIPLRSRTNVAGGKFEATEKRRHSREASAPASHRSLYSGAVQKLSV